MTTTWHTKKQSAQKELLIMKKTHEQKNRVPKKN